MTAARYDLTIDQGSDFSLTLTIKENGTAKDLSGWHGRASFRKTLDGSKTGDFVVNIIGAGGVARASDTKEQPTAHHGKLEFKLPYATSALVQAGTYFYDLEIFYNDNADPTVGTPSAVSRIMGGSVNLRREVTR